MYRQGEVRTTTASCLDADESGYCFEDDHKHRLRDSRSKNVYGALTAYLPHSCDEWVIGGVDEIKQMIADLKATLILIEGMRTSD